MRTSELIGPALDWAVAKCEGHEHDPETTCFVNPVWIKDALTGENEVIIDFRPSTSWAQGGPIIEREEIHWIDNGRSDKAGKPFKWMATKSFSDPLNNHYGPTPLVAAMRCYVASKLGDEVEIPEELK